MEIAQDKRCVLSSHRFELLGENSKSGMGISRLLDFWVGLNAHSGWVRYHEFEEDRAFQRIQIPDELALAQTNPDPWLSPIDRENILEGEKHFQRASNFGLFTNGEALSRLAWFEYLSGDAEQSVELLGQAAEHQKGQARALSLYYRGTILNRLGRYQQARTSHDAA